MNMKYCSGFLLALIPYVVAVPATGTPSASLLPLWIAQPNDTVIGVLGKVYDKPQEMFRDLNNGRNPNSIMAFSTYTVLYTTPLPTAASASWSCQVHGSTTTMFLQFASQTTSATGAAVSATSSVAATATTATSVATDAKTSTLGFADATTATTATTSTSASTDASSTTTATSVTTDAKTSTSGSPGAMTATTPTPTCTGASGTCVITPGWYPLEDLCSNCAVVWKGTRLECGCPSLPFSWPNFGPPLLDSFLVNNAGEISATQLIDVPGNASDSCSNFYVEQPFALHATCGNGLGAYLNSTIDLGNNFSVKVGDNNTLAAFRPSDLAKDT